MVRYLDARGWGVIHWARPIIDVVFDGVAKTVDYQMIRLCRSETQGEQLYHRIQRAPLHTPATMDDASPSHVQALLGEAEALLARGRDAGHARRGLRAARTAARGNRRGAGVTPTTAC